jgi:hypothetical protein
VAVTERELRRSLDPFYKAWAPDHVRTALLRISGANLAMRVAPPAGHVSILEDSAGVLPSSGEPFHADEVGNKRRRE